MERKIGPLGVQTAPGLEHPRVPGDPAGLTVADKRICGDTGEMTLGLRDALRGQFIVFDGPDGSGKGTQIELLRKALTAEGLSVVYGKDPGGTEIGNRIRHEVLGHDLSKMDRRCETFLFMASRAQLVGEVIEPALREKKVVLCDRFVSATCAYQGAAGYDIARVIELAGYAIGNTWPNLTMVLDIDVETGFERTGRKSHHVGKNRKRTAGQQTLFDDVQPDAMEARPIAFHRQVRELFLSLPPNYPGRVEVIDSSASPEEVHQRVLSTLAKVYS
ncbi:MAG: dTMP kinase [bacterium]|nr:dTMP kinase [bacterium]